MMEKADKVDIVSGWVGGVAGAVGCHPFDIVKCRVQSQGSGNIPIRYRSGFHCFTEIIKREGNVKGLFKGVLPPMVMQGAINAIVFGVERATSRFLSPILGSGPQKEVIIGTCAGMTAGFVQTIVCAPMELVKLQTQHQAIGQATSYQGNLATLRNIVRWGGVKGCYQGFWITALRDTPAFGVYFATYEGLMHFTAESKGIGRKDLGWQFSFYYGGCAGVASWLVNYPVDLVKTRIQLDGGSGKVRQYRSSWDCFMKIWNEGGVRLLYRGLGPCLIRAFANSAFVFVAYEATSHYLYRL